MKYSEVSELTALTNAGRVVAVARSASTTGWCGEGTWGFAVRGGS